MTNIGIIAGNGNLPILIAKEAQDKNAPVYVCAIQGEASPKLESMCSGFSWVKIGQLGKLVDFFKKNNVTQAVMAGKITKINLFKGNVQPDLEMVKVISKIKDWKDDSLLLAITNYLDSKGIKILDSTLLVRSLLPEEGVLSKQKPNEHDEAEIIFGWKMAKEIARLDIGQTVVTKNKSVVAVESIEGTDRAILRGGELASGAVNVFKVAKPNQDMRFDVPTVGLETLDVMIRSKVRMLVFEANKTILLDREEFLKKANQHKMIVVARKVSS